MKITKHMTPDGLEFEMIEPEGLGKTHQVCPLPAYKRVTILPHPAKVCATYKANKPKADTGD